MPIFARILGALLIPPNSYVPYVVKLVPGVRGPNYRGKIGQDGAHLVRQLPATLAQTKCPSQNDRHLPPLRPSRPKDSAEELGTRPTGIPMCFSYNPNIICFPGCFQYSTLVCRCSIWRNTATLKFRSILSGLMLLWLFDANTWASPHRCLIHWKSSWASIHFSPSSGLDTMSAS